MNLKTVYNNFIIITVVENTLFSKVPKHSMEIFVPASKSQANYNEFLAALALKSKVRAF